MEYTTLGNSDLKVSRLCLGCMSFGEASLGQYQWTLNYQESTDIIHKAYEVGINFFDTSNNYSEGTSELFLGKAVKEIGRDNVVIASKCYFNPGRLSPEAIHREVGKSLERLNTAYLDILILHRFDYDTPVEETLKALDEEVRAGRIRYYGASSMFGYQFADYCYTAMIKGYRPFVTLQNHYNLIYREDERDLIPVAEKFGVSRTSFAPYASGRLSRPNWDTDSKRSILDRKEGTRYDAYEEHDRKIAERVLKLAGKHGVSMANICLAWQYEKKVAAPIIGITKEKYLEDALRCFEVKLSAEEVAYLEELYLPHPISCNR